MVSLWILHDIFIPQIDIFEPQHCAQRRFQGSGHRGAETRACASESSTKLAQQLAPTSHTPIPATPACQQAGKGYVDVSQKKRRWWYARGCAYGVGGQLRVQGLRRRSFAAAPSDDARTVGPRTASWSRIALFEFGIIACNLAMASAPPVGLSQVLILDTCFECSGGSVVGS